MGEGWKTTHRLFRSEGRQPHASWNSRRSASQSPVGLANTDKSLLTLSGLARTG